MEERDKMKRVYTYGAFDLLHPGHIKLLERAKTLGDFLIVGIVSDDAIKKLKGSDRPIQSQQDRAFIIENINCVDEVILQDGYDPSRYLKDYKEKIDFLVKGDDWEHIPGTETINELGGTLVKLTYSKSYSSSNIIKKIRKEKTDE